MNVEAVFYRGKATAEFELGQWKAAQEDFQRARDLNPEDPENWIGLAMSLAMDLHTYQGIQVLEEFIAKYSGYVRAYTTMGLLYFRMGVIHKGREYLQHALVLNPTLEERQLIQSQIASTENSQTTRRPA